MPRGRLFTYNLRMRLTKLSLDSLPILRMESDFLRLDISPYTGGRILSLYHKLLRQELLWRNEALPLRVSRPGEPYDPNFWGGIDEVIPGDLPEQILGLDNPDHGELWTLPLDLNIGGNVVSLEGTLPIWGLQYRKRIFLRSDGPWVDLYYHIHNPTAERRCFLWKLHAAVQIAPGDRILCPAEWAVAADPQWSRWKEERPFQWPIVEGQRADVIPAPDGTTDFLFLYGLREGRLSLLRPSCGCQLSIAFDPQVFPYVCYFASYGGFDGHYTAVLEPATAMPLSVNEAARLGQCSVLGPGESLNTQVSLYAGPLRASSMEMQQD